MQEVRHVSIAIACHPEKVYEFASNPVNLPRWAEGLARSEVYHDGDHWVADSPMGEVRIRFAAPNSLGVLDHDVTLPSGETVHNPMRVVPNGEGSEVTFVLFRRPGVDFAADLAMVEGDLDRLKGLLRRKP